MISGFMKDEGCIRRTNDFQKVKKRVLQTASKKVRSKKEEKEGRSENNGTGKEKEKQRRKTEK